MIFVCCVLVCFDQTLKTILDRGHKLPFPNGIVINGRGPNATTFTVEKGNLRFGFSTDFRLEWNNLKLIFWGSFCCCCCCR